MQRARHWNRGNAGRRARQSQLFGGFELVQFVEEGLVVDVMRTVT